MEDKADFDMLFREYYPQLYCYAYQLIDDMEAGKDIASDAFETIWVRYAEINRETARAYLYTYVRNRCIDFLRHQDTRRQYARLCEQLTGGYAETEYREWDERILTLQRAMRKLTPHTRHILELCYVEHKKYKEVAEELGISVSAVRKHIVKALQILREECVKKV